MCSPAEMELNGTGEKASQTSGSDKAVELDTIKGVYNVFYRQRMRHIVLAVEASLKRQGKGLDRSIQEFIKGFSGTWTQFWQSTEAMLETKIPSLERGWLHDNLQTLGRRILSASPQEK